MLTVSKLFPQMSFILFLSVKIWPNYFQVLWYLDGKQSFILFSKTLKFVLSICSYWVLMFVCVFCEVDSEEGAVCDPGCLVLESDFLLSGELEFGDSEIMGLDREAGKRHTHAVLYVGRLMNYDSKVQFARCGLNR